MSNYTAGHESRASEIGEARLAYPEAHVEADNRLSWMLGKLDATYGPDAFYVHLVRDRDEVVRSFGNRWDHSFSIVRFLAEGVYGLIPELLGDQQKTRVCEDYVDIVNANIEMFLRDKPHQMVMRLENVEEDFRRFWNSIGAEGDIEAAVQQLHISHNAGQSEQETERKERKLALETQQRILRKRLSMANGLAQKLSIRLQLLAVRLAQLNT